MADKPATKRSQSSKRTIILPITQEPYAEIIPDAKRFRVEWLEPNYVTHLERFDTDGSPILIGIGVVRAGVVI